MDQSLGFPPWTAALAFLGFSLAMTVGRLGVMFLPKTVGAMTHAPDAEWVTFLDSDLWFFDSPDRVFDAIGEAPVAIVPHRFSPRLKGLEKFGVYNVGWVTFRRNEEGVRCLEGWRTKCIEWCHGWVDGDRYADQRYLDHFCHIAPHTKVLDHKGCNLAPWNIENCSILLRGGTVWVDDHPLLFFHFHGIKRSLRVLFFDNHRYYGAQHTRVIRNDIYRPYVQSFLDAEKLISQSHVNVAASPITPPGGRGILGIDVMQSVRTLRRGAYQLVDLVQGWPIVASGDRAR